MLENKIQSKTLTQMNWHQLFLQNDFKTYSHLQVLFSTPDILTTMVLEV